MSFEVTAKEIAESPITVCQKLAALVSEGKSMGVDHLLALLLMRAFEINQVKDPAQDREFVSQSSALLDDVLRVPDFNVLSQAMTKASMLAEKAVATGQGERVIIASLLIRQGKKQVMFSAKTDLQ